MILGSLTCILPFVDDLTCKECADCNSIPSVGSGLLLVGYVVKLGSKATILDVFVPPSSVSPAVVTVTFGNKLS